MMYDGVVVHYSEIALKGHNRGVFERRLRENIERVLGPGHKVRRLSGRLLIEFSKSLGAGEASRITTQVSRVFGVEWCSAVVYADLSIEDISSKAVRLLSGLPGKRFKVETKRQNKRFPYTSLEVNKIVGERVRRELGLDVDLTNPELVVGVEVLEGLALVYAGRVRGPGGLPVGVSGRVLALVSGGIDSPVAAWLVAKRGCLVDYVHFHPYPPGVSPEKLSKLVRIAKALARYTIESDLYLLPCGPATKRLARIAVCGPGASPESSNWGRYSALLLRLFMLRSASRIARSSGHMALVVGDSIGQVASQTLHNIVSLTACSPMVVLRPLLGLDKNEIVSLAKRIGTYEISIEDYPDCCTAQSPRHVATRSAPDKLESLYSSLGLEDAEEEALEEARVVRIRLTGGDAVVSEPQPLYVSRTTSSTGQ